MSVLWVLVALAAEPETATVALEKYAGTWYELARYDAFFERGCVASVSKFSAQKGELHIVNTCHQDTLDGKLKTVEGKAWVPDPASSGKMKIQFFWPFSGDYWVLELAPDYSWALVGNAKKSNCWVMSRTSKLDEALYQTLLGKLRARGYDPSKLLRVKQPN